MSNPIKERRFGEFSFCRLDLQLEDVFWAFANADLVVLDARVDPCLDTIEYKAAWEEFDALEKGEFTPRYQLHIKNGVLTAERVTG